ncbi:hypothetical protein [Subtercola lobariae]|uniref:Uncharacterized protein n=1 Tax=Subtercola lobariae TaxID=1588641 RepID=A0A917ETV2_9MICO|nr:hypothetical protein [Subtercola lobariae]GGF11323.1 hypothetical protein GCM10011399_01430 [Subtercola lobariae]
MSATTIRVEFPPRMMSRELAAYYIGKSVRDLDALREQNEITPKGTGRRVLYDKRDLDRHCDNLPERSSSRSQKQ